MKYRNNYVDGVRGLAIIIMFAANLWPYALPTAHCPVWLRLIFSMAAPLFIFLSGVSICFAEEAGKASKTLYKRIFQVLLVGVMIDAFVWQIVPFYNFDVLYLISFSLLLILGIRHLPSMLQILITLGLLAANFFLLDQYSFEMATIELSGNVFDYQLNTALSQWILSGWFPVLPWTGISCCGYLLTKHRLTLQRFNPFCLGLGVILILACVYLYSFQYESVQPLREGYAELFYPVKNYFWLLLFGIMFSLVPVLNSNYDKAMPLSGIGKKSLFLYLLHTVIIAYLIPFVAQNGASINWFHALLTFIGFYSVLIGINHMVKPMLPALIKGKYQVIGYLLGI